MGSLCMNKVVKQNQSNDESNKHQIKQYNPKVASSGISYLTFQSQNFNLYDSVVKKLNFDENAIESGNGNSIITFTTSNKKEFKFTKIYLLGEGTFGKVLLVRHNDADNIYAMKILDKKFIKCYNQKTHTLNERAVLEKINSAFIIKLEFAFQSPDKLYLITEFAQGGELFYHLENEKAFHLERAKLYIAEIALALEALHSNNCIYRDLKPENILLDAHGHIKLTDFGLSNSNLINDKAFSICGTPGYFAPEVLGDEGYDKRADYFSLGIIFYQMVTGKQPFEKLKGLVPNKRNKQIIFECFSQPINYNLFTAESQDFCEKLLSRNVQDRFQSINEIMKHEFFTERIEYSDHLEEIYREKWNWMKVEYRQYTPMFVPHLHNNVDVQYFSKFFTSQNPNVADYSSNKQSVIESQSYNQNKDYIDFTYINTNELKKES